MNRLHSFVNRLITLADETRTKELRKKYNLPDSFRFNGQRILLYGDGEIKVGENTYVGDGSTIQSADGRTVSIGHDCAISHGVRMYTESRDPDHDITSGPTILGDITIGDKVWVGANAYIGPGITIGDHAVVGANSVVTRDVASWTIVGGVPAKPIRRKRHAPEGM